MMEKFYSLFYNILSNRQKSRIAKKTKFWCSKCDASLVGQYGKCKNCGFIENKNKGEKTK